MPPSCCLLVNIIRVYGSSLIIIITSFRLSRPLTRGISPAEVNGLVSVLRLVAAVASNCEAARVAIAENTAWQPLLLGWPRPRIGLHKVVFFRKAVYLRVGGYARKISE